MEIRKINFNLPVLSGDNNVDYFFEEELCSCNCLLNNGLDFKYAISSFSNKDNAIFITKRNTIIKKRKIKNDYLWNEFGEQYFVSKEKQEKIYNDLIISPVQGLAKILSLCDCSIETEYINGGMLNNFSNPIVHYYEKNYKTSNKISELNFVEVINKAGESLKNIHDRGLSHGDPCAQNIIITEDNNCVFIDFDMLMSATKQSIKRDLFIFYFFAVLPTGRKCLDSSKFSNLLKNLVAKIINYEKENNLYKIDSNYYENQKGIVDNNSLSWFIDFCYNNLIRLDRDNYNIVKEIKQHRVNVLETSRILNSRIDVIERDRAERLKVINNLDSIVKEKEKIIETLEKELSYRSEIENENNKLKNTINELTNKLGDLTNILNGLTNQVEVLNNENAVNIRNYEDRIKELKNVNTVNSINYEDMISKIKQENYSSIQALSKENLELKKLINVIYSSTSWKITKPFRFGAKVIKKIIKFCLPYAVVINYKKRKESNCK